MPRSYETFRDLDQASGQAFHQPAGKRTEEIIRNIEEDKPMAASFFDTLGAVAGRFGSWVGDVASDFADQAVNLGADYVEFVGQQQVAEWMRDLGMPPPLEHSAGWSPPTGQPFVGPQREPTNFVQTTFNTPIPDPYMSATATVPTTGTNGSAPAGAPAAAITVKGLQERIKYTTGRHMTHKQMVHAIKCMGPAYFQQQTGLTTAQIFWILMKPVTRRGRGISAADLRRTRATLGKVKRIRRDMRSFCAGR